MPDTASLLWGVLFGSIGLAYFVYGRKQHQLVPFLCGIGLMTYPFVVSGLWPMVIVGVVLTALPYFLRI